MRLSPVGAVETRGICWIRGASPIIEFQGLLLSPGSGMGFSVTTRKIEFSNTRRAVRAMANSNFRSFCGACGENSRNLRRGDFQVFGH